MKQETAVEFLLEKLYNEYRFEFSGTIVEHAKQMEKQQITDAFDAGTVDNNLIGNEYYKETYKK